MFSCDRFLVFAMLGLLTPAVSLGSSPASTQLMGGPIEYTVRPGETLLAIAGRLGVNWHAVAEANALGNPDHIYPGQRLRVDTTRIVPATHEDGILINIPEAVLYYFEGGRVVFHAGVGLGKPIQWETPTGRFTILRKDQHPTWVVPRSIRQEMAAEGQVVLTQVPPGPNNPLGEFWLGLTIPGYGIHGTIEPSSLGRYRSHGCIRMHPDDIRTLSHHVRLGTPGALLYQPVKVAQVRDQVYLEVHPDVYGRNIDVSREAEAILRTVDVPIDWNRAADVVRRQAGVPELISLQSRRVFSHRRR